MRLLTKTTLIQIAAFLVAFLIAGVLVFTILDGLISEEVEEQLMDQKRLISGFANSASGPEQLHIPSLKITPLSLKYDPLDSLSFPPFPGKMGEGIFVDTMISVVEPADEEEETEIEDVPFRRLRWHQWIAKKPYQLEIQQPLLETKDAMEAIALGMIPTVLLLTLVMVVLLRWTSKRLWRPFDESLSLIAQFRPQNTSAFEFPSTKTTEFARLNAILQRMTNKVQADYQNLKTFTDNASHEMQTPLAIVQSHLDAFLQSPQLPEADIAHIASCLNALQRLRRLNDGLLTLSKIENGIFAAPQNLDLNALVLQQIQAVSELADLQTIQIDYQALAFPILQTHPILCELIVSNLLSNAIRHNVYDGKILVRLDTKALTISNSGQGSPLDGLRLFQRFQKQNPESQGLGLGLSIVKECCDRAGMQVAYSFQNNMHNFVIALQIQDSFRIHPEIG